MEREHCAAWPQELKEAEQRRYRAVCRVKMLEAQLDRIGPEESQDFVRHSKKMVL